jgi:hypothetical protein
MKNAAALAEVGEGEHIAGAALFLASEDARFVTGEALGRRRRSTAAGPNLLKACAIPRRRACFTMGLSGVDKGSTGQPSGDPSQGELTQPIAWKTRLTSPGRSFEYARSRSTAREQAPCHCSRKRAFSSCCAGFHFLAGITWIGILYYLNLVQTPLLRDRPRRTGAQRP